jgi:hypothetical protein
MTDTIEAVRSKVTAVVHHIDRKRWAELEALYAPVVETDYTSLFGGAPASGSAEALVAGWRNALERVTTQHLLGPIEVRISGSRAEAYCHVRAFHHRPGAPHGEDWEVLGHYRFELVGAGTEWQITRMTLETLHQLGNRQLLADPEAR